MVPKTVFQQKASHSEGKGLPIFWEIFAGCAKFSLCMQCQNFQVLPVDHDGSEHQPLTPVLFADLRELPAQQMLLQRLKTDPPCCIHFAMPCGTGSRARERPISVAKRKMGVPQPPPLRSGEHPLGIPGLGAFHAAKVASANKLLEFVVLLLVECWLNNIHVILENPERSWIWAAITALVLKHSSFSFHRWYNNLSDVDFDACEHGGLRPKSTRLKTSIPQLQSLARRCSKSHVHAPYGTTWDGHKWTFDTSMEAEYPLSLCERLSAILAKFFKLPPQPLVSARASQIASTQRQHKSCRPLISEYRCVQTIPDGVEPSNEYKLLENLTPTGDSDRVRHSKAGKRVGIYHNKQEFLDKAVKCKHPCNSFEAVTDISKKVVKQLFTEGFAAIAKQRISQISRLSQMKKELECEELRFKATLPKHCAEVLGSKSMLLWRKLLEETGYKDKGVFELMCGTPLVGCHSKSEIFGEKIILAKTSEELLRIASLWRNPTLMARLAHDDDPEMQKILWQETMSEVDKGFINGPFNSLDEVKAALGTSTVCVVRRFAILQGSGTELKPRVIDDAKESGLNSAYTCQDRLDLHDFDHVSSLASFIGAHVEAAKRKVGLCQYGDESLRLHPDLLERPAWSGRCLDLTKAYKQIPISSNSRSLMVLMVPKPGEKRQVFFTTASMPFGCAASVFSFNRITRSLLHLMQTLLSVIGGVFYDDFALLEPSASARMCSMASENFLEILGWKFAKAGDKATSFESCFNLLGAQLDLQSLHLGRLTVANKPGRLEKMKDMLLDIKKKGKITKAEAQTVQGLLNYASGFFLGSSCRMATRCFSNLISDSKKVSGDDLSSLCDFTVACLEKTSPRSWTCSVHESNIVVFTDGSFENGVGLWGAVVLDDATGQRDVFWGQVPDVLIKGWNRLAGEQVISQIEAYAALLVRWYFRKQWTGRKAIFFQDNDAARYSLIKAASSSASMMLIVQAFHAVDASFPMMAWIERVPSASNIADWPSRGLQEKAADLIKGRLCGDILLDSELQESLTKHPSLPLSLLKSA